MRYLSLCSGIEAASVAWAPMGWQPLAFAEIEAFPSGVLKNHYPDVPNLGDITKFKEWPDLGTVDLICGGTPCQSFSVAGLRKGLADPRGNLSLTFLAIVDRYRPRYVIWENVPGVLSDDGGRSFASIVGGLGQLGYGWAYRVLDAQYVRVDGLGRAVPQRRRRVIVVGYLGDWRRAAAVLSEPESVLGNSPPRRQAGQGTAASVAPSLVSSGRGVERTGETRAEGFDASEDGTGRGTPLVPICFNSREDPEVTWDRAGPLGASSPQAQAIAFDWQQGGAESNSMRVWEEHTGTVAANRTQAIAFDTTQMTSAANRSAPKPGDPCHPLAAGAHPPAVAFQPRFARNDRGAPSEIAYPLTAEAGRTGKGDSAQCVQAGWAVRRLMPVECERLMGFPDGYTAITYRGKPAADGPRYKALGNSWAVNVFRWVGRRIEMVERIAADLERERAA